MGCPPAREARGRTGNVQRADFVIDTGGTFGDTNRQVDRVIERLLALAAAAER